MCLWAEMVVTVRECWRRSSGCCSRTWTSGSGGWCWRPRPGGWVRRDRLVARAAGVSEATVSRGSDELEAGAEPLGRARRPGGGPQAGRRPGSGAGPGAAGAGGAGGAGRSDVAAAVDDEVDPHLAGELTRQGHRVSADTVGDLLRERGVQPAGQRQDHRGDAAPGPGRAVPVYQRAGQGPPGRRGAGDQRGCQEEGAGRGVRATPGREWRPEGEPVGSRDHDFPGRGAGQGHPVRDL